MSKALVRMGIEDALHYTPADIEKIIAQYPEHERKARVEGIPMLGSGRVFPVAEESIKIDPLPIPEHWVLIGGIDFGWDHPTAAVRLAWDRDADVVYVTHEYAESEKTPILHAAALKGWNQWLPWAWPHDGLQHDKQSGETLANAYKQQGLRMLSNRATFPDGKSGVEAGLMDMLDRMQTSRLKVFSTLEKWFYEFRLYHRKDGKLVKERDDLMSATRYALMMLRYAKVKPGRQPQQHYNRGGANSWMAI